MAKKKARKKATKKARLRQRKVSLAREVKALRDATRALELANRRLGVVEKKIRALCQDPIVKA